MKKMAVVWIIAFLVAESSFVFAQKRGGLGALLGAGMRAAGSQKVYDADTLNVAALKNCLIKDRDISRNSEVIGTKQASLESQYTDLEKRESQIDSLSDFLEQGQSREFTSQSEVDRFNEKVDEYNKLLSAYNSSVSQYQSKQAALEAEIDAHNQSIDDFGTQCAGKQYYEDDMRVAQAAISDGN